MVQVQYRIQWLLITYNGCRVSLHAFPESFVLWLANMTATAAVSPEWMRCFHGNDAPPLATGNNNPLWFLLSDFLANFTELDAMRFKETSTSLISERDGFFLRVFFDVYEMMWLGGLMMGWWAVEKVSGLDRYLPNALRRLYTEVDDCRGSELPQPCYVRCWQSN